MTCFIAWIWNTPNRLMCFEYVVPSQWCSSCQRWSLAGGSESLGRKVFPFLQLCFLTVDGKCPATQAPALPSPSWWTIPPESVNQNEPFLPLADSWQVFIHDNKKNNKHNMYFHCSCILKTGKVWNYVLNIFRIVQKCAHSGFFLFFRIRRLSSEIIVVSQRSSFWVSSPLRSALLKKTISPALGILRLRTPSSSHTHISMSIGAFLIQVIFRQPCWLRLHGCCLWYFHIYNLTANSLFLWVLPSFCSLFCNDPWDMEVVL